MITVKYFIDYQLEQKQKKQQKVDDWLKIVVFKEWKGDRSGFEVPEWITVSELADMLVERGFTVNTHGGPQGNFVYLSIPVQED